MGSTDIYKCIIIGSGPAGYTAAIYAARAALQPLLFQGVEPGGQLMTTTDVENYPGYPNGVKGPAMMDDFRKQAERMGTEMRLQHISRSDFGSHPLRVWTMEGEEFRAHSIIIATGASAKWLGLESEKRLHGSGVSACAVCDGYFFRGQEVAVVGGGDTACEEALYLSKLCPQVHMLIRSDRMRASQIMQQRVRNAPNIRIYWNTETVEVLGAQQVEGVRVRDKQNGRVYDIPVKGFFVAIGHTPNSEPFRPWVETDEQGYIKTQPGSTRTNIAGVFAAGDVQDKVYRQAVTAAASGCMAALDAERYLSAAGLH
ncbi:MAG: thioredoxin-disulfide reductase [Chitinophagales bacterium]|nr:thioredoxin-disulfide reductase [Chitinophagales bacterium]MDW8427581.1 thioredoxin-disulfide reductase [Chitinophagales bacterium]